MVNAGIALLIITSVFCAGVLCGYALKQDKKQPRDERGRFASTKKTYNFVEAPESRITGSF